MTTSSSFGGLASEGKAIHYIYLTMTSCCPGLVWLTLVSRSRRLNVEGARSRCFPTGFSDSEEVETQCLFPAYAVSFLPGRKPFVSRDICLETRSTGHMKKAHVDDDPCKAR